MEQTSHIAILILAAGLSRRMPLVNKLLVEIDGKPMVRHVAETALASRADFVTVVTGNEFERVENVLGDLPLSFTHNRDFAEGMSASLKAGLSGLDDQAKGAVVMLGDMPDIDAAVIDRLIDCFEDTGQCKICVPVSGDKQGNPVLLPRWLFLELQSIDGDQGARQTILSYKDRIMEVEIESSAIHRDIDTPEDLDKLKEPATPKV